MDFCVGIESASGLLHVSEELLRELGLLFENVRGAVLANGVIDAGFNCFAKALVTACLAQLQGLDTDLCAGQALVAWVRPQPWTAYHVDPHAWAITKSGQIIDLSMTDLDGRKYFTVGHHALPDGTQPLEPRCTLSAKRFQKSLGAAPRLPAGAHIFYYQQKRDPLQFEDLRNAATRINSPATQAILARWPRKNVLARAILHSHLVLTGERQPLGVKSQLEAWTALADWRVDALQELKARHLASRQGQRQRDRSAAFEVA
jgi:hypothetical protein